MRVTQTAGALPVHILTGFLGSGKTTLLRRVLSEEAYGDTAVLMNEFGEVGLDQVLVGEIAPDVVLLNSGCLCCTLRGELRDALAHLLAQRTEGKLPAFKRVVVETTGLAKPALILSTVFADPQIRHHFTIGRVVTTVDCLHGTPSAGQPSEWLEQIAAADTLVLTKSDLIDISALPEMKHKLYGLNATAKQLESADLEVASLFDPAEYKQQDKTQKLSFGLFSGLLDPHLRTESQHYFGHEVPANTLHLRERAPIAWEAFGVWLSMLLHVHGNKILRVKGVVNIQGNSAPVVIQGVQHVIYPPEHLPDWAGNAPCTDLVFICRGIHVQQIEKSFNAFVLNRK